MPTSENVSTLLPTYPGPWTYPWPRPLAQIQESGPAKYLLKAANRSSGGALKALIESLAGNFYVEVTDLTSQCDGDATVVKYTVLGYSLNMRNFLTALDKAAPNSAVSS